ncbi:MAG: hypothetical protein ACLPY1_01670 [Terracidiphilus sp.]
MALLDGKNLAAEAAKRARFRVHHVGTKLNEAELHELEALAAKRKETQAELIRGLILHELARDQSSQTPICHPMHPRQPPFKSSKAVCTKYHRSGAQ